MPLPDANEGKCGGYGPTHGNVHIYKALDDNAVVVAAAALAALAVALSAVVVDVVVLLHFHVLCAPPPQALEGDAVVDTGVWCAPLAYTLHICTHDLQALSSRTPSPGRNGAGGPPSHNAYTKTSLLHACNHVD